MSKITGFTLFTIMFLCLINGVDAKSEKIKKVKLSYQFMENTSRTYLITFKQDLIYEGDDKDTSEYSVKVEDFTTKASKSKATIKRTFKGFKLSVHGQNYYNNLDSGEKGDKPFVAEVFKALQGKNFEFSVSSTGKVSGIKGYKDIYNSVMKEVFGDDAKSEKDAETKFVQNLLVTWLDKEVLEADISYVYTPITKSSLKVDSTWKAKPHRRINMGVHFDSPEEYKVVSIEEKDENVILKIKARGELDEDETKEHKAEYNKSKGEFTFNQTSGEVIELTMETKAKYLLKSEEAMDEDADFDKSEEVEQTVTVKLLSKSTTGNPKVKIITSMGDFTVELFEDEMPNTVANFIELCEAKFYDDIRFHRIIKGFMIQVGCPYAKGKVTARAGQGDAGYKFADENLNKFKFDKKGLLAMANSGPNTNGSQIFITLGAAEHLNGGYSLFGKVIEGMDIVEKIGNVQTIKPGDKPVNEVYIKETKILQKRNHEYKVEKID